MAPMEDDATTAAAGAEGGGDAGAAPGPSQLPEVELYSYLLVLVYLLDRKHFTQVRTWPHWCAVCSKGRAATGVHVCRCGQGDVQLHSWLDGAALHDRTREAGLAGVLLLWLFSRGVVASAVSQCVMVCMRSMVYCEGWACVQGVLQACPVTPSLQLLCVLCCCCFLFLLQAREVADAAVGLLQQHNRRTLDAIGARIYFYYSWAYECTGALADVRR